MATLPKELNYTEKLQALPSQTKTISIVNSPVNGSSFSMGGDLIQFDLVNRGFLVPGSLYLRYKHTFTNGITASSVLGTPAYATFSRSEVIMGANVVESVSNYGQLCNMIINCKLNYSQKLSMATAFGILDNSTGPTFSNLNGGTIPVSATTTFSRAMPLLNILAQAENLVPLGMLPAVRIQLTTDTLSNICLNTTTVTGGTVSEVELCYDVVEFGPEVEALVRSMSDANGNLVIKSSGYTTSTVSVPAASSGTLEYIFNQRISSIKSIFALFSPTTTGSKNFAAKDITKSLGDYQFYIGGEAYPPRPLNAKNKSGMLIELAQAWSNAGSVDATNMSINPIEWNRVDGTDDTSALPGKFYIGANTERLHTSAILTGVSSQLSPISLRLNVPTASTDAHNLTLITYFDSLIELNVITRQASVKQ